ncbi:SIR2 family anti-phage-associated protein [Methylocystis sp. B8]|uniref:SIR2 family anti-phage-associated protein n=1 Tax=Methylocystis sp. B8 TaxID=544938 RepID=UPI0010FEF504|nr:SIR2 family anti-phage-associated protein [Methylocystis sp. B8]TLG78145.1 hypothetical protein FEV16_06175 [Methylocystis sp. B8]
MNFFAVRGSRELSEEEFKAHLALTVRLENVGAFLGAGASVSAGGKTLAEVWADFLNVYPETIAWLVEHKFIKKNQACAEAVVNLEQVMDALDLASIEWSRAERDGIADLDIHRSNLRRVIVKAALLQPDLWERPDTAPDNEAIGDHVRLLSRLVSNRQPGQAAPWVYTVNYDLAIEWAAEALGLHLVNGFTGLHSRAFSPASFDLGLRNTQARGEARFGTYNVYLGKAHGSLSWIESEDGSVVELPSRAQWADFKKFINAEAGVTCPGLLIFPGAAKFVQTAGFIYGEIVRRLTEFMSRPNTCLIISGYAFNDDHINRVILSALQNPTLQIVIYLPELDRFEMFPTIPRPQKTLTPNLMLARLIKRQLPQVTVCGFGARAFFSQMTKDLPEPALLDDAAQRARDLERLLRGPANQTVAVPTGTITQASEAPLEDGAEA